MSRVRVSSPAPHTALMVKLLFPHPTPDVTSKMQEADDFIRRWVARDGTFDYLIPQTIEQAKQVAATQLAAFDDLLGIAARAGDDTLRLVPDTNALMFVRFIAFVGSCQLLQDRRQIEVRCYSRDAAIAHLEDLSAGRRSGAALS
jgi:hypothetical protein